MRLRDALIIYTYRKMNEIEQDKEVLNSSRYKGAFDSLDMYELMRADIRLQCWKEFIDDLYKIILNWKV